MPTRFTRHDGRRHADTLPLRARAALMPPLLLATRMLYDADAAAIELRRRRLLIRGFTFDVN